MAILVFNSSSIVYYNNIISYYNRNHPSIWYVLILYFFYILILFKEYFTNVKFGCLFLSFFFFSTSLIPMIFLCSTFVSTTKQANLLGFLMFLIGLFLQTIFTNGMRKSKYPQIVLNEYFSCYLLLVQSRCT